MAKKCPAAIAVNDRPQSVKGGGNSRRWPHGLRLGKIGDRIDHVESLPDKVIRLVMSSFRLRVGPHRRALPSLQPKPFPLSRA
jgi:hypothetical protein